MLDKVKAFFKNHAEQEELIPILFVMGVVPLIVRQKDYMTNLQGFSWYGAEPMAVDLFNYYKRGFLLAAAALMLLFLLVGFLDGSIRVHKMARLLLIPLAVYEVLAVLSGVFSKFRWFSIHGTIGHFETIAVLLAYGLFFFYTVCAVRQERDVRTILEFWGVFLIPMALLGIFQAAGHDFYGTELGKRLIMTSDSLAAGDVVQQMFEKGRVYLSLYNPNYVGSFVAMTLPVTVILCIYSEKRKSRLFYGSLAAGLFVCLLGSASKTGLLAFLFALLCLGIFMRRQIVGHKKMFLGAAAAAAVCGAVLALVWGGNLQREIGNMQKGFGKDTTVYNLEGIETGEDGVRVSYKGNQLAVQSEMSLSGTLEFTLRDGQGNPVKLEDGSEAGVYMIKDPRFEGITLKPVSFGDIPSFDLNIEGKSWYFTNQSIYQGYFYLSPNGKYARIRTAPHHGFEGYEKFATSRGYIWSRTFPLLKERFFLGNGPDSFLMSFPQDDYVVKARYGFENQLISKPHNLFLQIGVQTGVLSLGAYLILFGIYAFWSLKLYWKNPMDGWLPAVGAAIFSGAAAYMAVGITADSSVNVAPVFWCLLGLGAAVNELVEAGRYQKKRKQMKIKK